ncbi:flagellar export protein FliJ [Sanguibacter antarcticus]|uniref:Flagellar FliJ protein n=1 Tax=Sanguibacter antarcticus TaxID=372484 RepID=A0A2A9E1J1_9MICO|nr:flagellar export protein FliJ [Sanguibacter antarcticus]PFG32235.1 flagellar FliJ protein [Sanguibacter antarcticus]
MSAFRLAGLMRFRKLQEDQAAADLASANASRRRAEARRAQATRELTIHEFQTDLGVAVFHASVASRAALRSFATETSVAVEVAATEVQQRELAWTDARKRSVPLEKLAERHIERENVEDLRVEQLALDEIAGRAPSSRIDGDDA